jgi:two-component system cell cycle response regulator CpdR
MNSAFSNVFTSYSMAKILLAEDNRLTRVTLDQFLRGQGYAVDLAEDGAQALSLLNENAFDLVISDIVLPKVNGWDLMEHVNSISPDTPVLLMTAYSQVQPRDGQLRGTPELILKPFLLTDFLSKIERLIDQKKSS